jgi:diaminopimelate epimerase
VAAGRRATLVACHRLGLADRRARLDLPGGPLQIHWEASSGHVIMDGPAEHVFDGVIPSAEAVQEARRQAAGAGLEQPAMGKNRLLERGLPQLQPRPPPQRMGWRRQNPFRLLQTIQCAVVRASMAAFGPRPAPAPKPGPGVAALLAGSSLDDLVAIASNSLESRIRSRISGPGEAG